MSLLFDVPADYDFLTPPFSQVPNLSAADNIWWAISAIDALYSTKFNNWESASKCNLQSLIEILETIENLAPKFKTTKTF